MPRSTALDNLRPGPAAKPRQPTRLFGALDERRPVLLDDPIQDGLLGPVPLVAVGLRAGAVTCGMDVTAAR